MANELPVSRVVRTTVNLPPAASQSQSLSDLMVLGTTNVIDPVEGYRVYASLDAVATDFGTAAPEYYEAQAWFGQSPQPLQIYIARWAQAAIAGGLQCGPLSTAEQVMSNWTAIVAGKFAVQIDGAGAIQIGPLDFSGATTLNGVAALIDAGVAGATCVWNATYSRFEFQSGTTGATSAVSFLAAPSAGVDISALLKGRSTSSGAYVYTGLAAQTLAAALADYDNRIGQRWYSAVAPTASDNDVLSGAAYIEGASNKHVLGVGTAAAGVLDPAGTTDIAYVLQQLEYRRSVVQYNASTYAIASLLGRIQTTNYDNANTVITLKFKNEPGITASNLTTSQADAAESKNANVFVAYENDTAIVEQGVMCDGTFVDVLMGTDWLALAIQRALFNLLYTSPTKIPQTDKGVQILQTAIEGVCAQAVLNGLVAPGVWDSDGFGQLQQGEFLSKGYYVYATPISEQDPADRAARKAPPFKVAVKLAGAIHSADVEINVNQ